MMGIRNFKPTDLNKVYEIECKSFKDPYHPLFLLNLYELYQNTFFVAEENGILTGYVISRIVDDRGHILAIAVEPQHRGRGFGRALIETVVNRFKNLNIKEIWLEVRVSNSGAVEFYKKLGFRESGAIPYYYSDGEEAIILKKYLM